MSGSISLSNILLWSSWTGIFQLLSVYILIMFRKLFGKYFYIFMNFRNKNWNIEPSSTPPLPRHIVPEVHLKYFCDYILQLCHFWSLFIGSVCIIFFFNKSVYWSFSFPIMNIIWFLTTGIRRRFSFFFTDENHLPISLSPFYDHQSNHHFPLPDPGSRDAETSLTPPSLQVQIVFWLGSPPFSSLGRGFGGGRQDSARRGGERKVGVERENQWERGGREVWRTAGEQGRCWSQLESAASQPPNCLQLLL